MEVGAVKQDFNNEIIQLKKNLNQAKIQIIHKLTRKAKSLTEKKAPEALKDKLKRKAETAVKEVMIIKKIKARDIARFIVTHTGKLNEYLNKPAVDNNKACARLLLHKALQAKYKHIRGKFSNVSIKDLFMSRQERRNLKKEAKEKQKNKKKKKDNSSAVNVEGEWDVENNDNINRDTEEKEFSADKVISDDEILDDDDKTSVNDAISDKSDMNDDDETNNVFDDDLISDRSDQSDGEIEESNIKASDSDDIKIINNIKLNKVTQNSKIAKESKKLKQSESFDVSINKRKQMTENKSKINKKVKENKNKNLNEKLQKRTFTKESDDVPMKAIKVVDPFFITSTGDNYMSLVEPRQPDEIKEFHKEGNRQYRRAVMFGHVPKIKPKKNIKMNNTTNNKFVNNRNQKAESGEKRNNFNRKEKFGKVESEPEKLHPSWEAKKKQSGILPFQGKKIVFD